MGKYDIPKKIENVQEYCSGETYLVPTFVDLNSGHFEQGFHEDNKVTYITYPIYPHLHNDVENGQELPHYHVDMRFAPSGALWLTRIYPDQFNYVIEYHPWKMTNYHEPFHTPVSMISKSKLKHKCIYKGKCPHRGYDLTLVKPNKGVITCPLHGLKFKDGILL